MPTSSTTPFNQTWRPKEEGAPKRIETVDEYLKDGGTIRKFDREGNEIKRRMEFCKKILKET